MQQDGTGRILPQRLFRIDYAVTETRRCANFRLRSRHCAATYASPPHRCHDSLTCGARGKFMGLRDPFTILRNVRDTTSPTAPSVDLVRFPSWRIACIKPNTALFRVPPKIRAHLKTSVKRRTFGRSVEEG